MTTPKQARARRLQAITLALTGVLAVALVGITWLSVTSLPYLAVSPSTDPRFGALNACLLSAVPERVGFAVSPDLSRVAAWSPSTLVECSGSPPTARTWSRSGVTHGAYDGTGALWISTRSTGGAGTPQLLRQEHADFVERGAFAPSALVGTKYGILALDPQGQLVALASDGAVTATRALPIPRDIHLVANADGSLVALFGGGRFAVVDAKTLVSTPAEVPCSVTWVWWRPENPLLWVACVDMSIEVNAVDSQSALLDPRRRKRSVLSGPTGVYVEPCDQLPCSVAP